MNGAWMRVALVVLALLVEIASGLWLRRAGRPYGPLVFAVHKIILVYPVVVLATHAFHALASGRAVTSTGIIAVIALASLVAAAASGGWMAVSASCPPVLAVLHRLLPLLIVPLTAASFYLRHAAP